MSFSIHEARALQSGYLHNTIRNNLSYGSYDGCRIRNASRKGICVIFVRDSSLSGIASASVKAGSSIASMTRPALKNTEKSSHRGLWK